MIAIVIGVVVALGALGVFVMSRNSSTATPENNSNSASDINTNENGENTPTSLRSLMSFAENQQCSFADSETESEGNVYVSGGNMRGDFTTISDNTTAGSHVIVRGDNLYLWMDSSEDGFRTSITEIEEATSEIGKYARDAGSALNLDQEVDYECSPWAADNTMFEVPTNVNFQDFGAMMQDAIGESKEELNVSCDVCDNLPTGEAQDQCIQALGC